MKNLLRKLLNAPPMRPFKAVLKKIHLIFLFGTSRQCPVCGFRLRRFLAIPDIYRENIKRHGHDHDFSEVETINADEYICPQCGSTDRDRLYWLFIKAKQERQQLKVLDFAPALCLQKNLKSIPGVSYRSCDLFMPDADDRMDIQNLQYQDNSFDFLICSHVLEHVPDDKRAMAELYRVLRPGGAGICMVPISLKLKEDRENTFGPNLSAAEKWKYFGQDDHIRMYSKEGFKKKLASVGFRVREYSPHELTQNRSPEYYGIDEKSVLYVVEK